MVKAHCVFEEEDPVVMSFVALPGRGDELYYAKRTWRCCRVSHRASFGSDPRVTILWEPKI